MSVWPGLSFESFPLLIAIASQDDLRLADWYSSSKYATFPNEVGKTLQSLASTPATVLGMMFLRRSSWRYLIGHHGSRYVIGRYYKNVLGPAALQQVGAFSEQSLSRWQSGLLKYAMSLAWGWKHGAEVPLTAGFSIIEVLYTIKFLTCFPGSSGLRMVVLAAISSKVYAQNTLASHLSSNMFITYPTMTFSFTFLLPFAQAMRRITGWSLSDRPFGPWTT